MAASNQPQLIRRFSFRALPDDIFNPWATSIDQRSCLKDSIHASRAVCGLDMPEPVSAFRFGHTGMRHNLSTMLLGITGVENNQPRIFYPAIRIFKGMAKLIF